MPVHNGEKYVVDAIESILDQTFGDFEFIIIDDASQDNSLAILKEYALRDERIRVIENKHNQGISVSLNKGIAIARGEYIARMDADDISLPERFAVQTSFMDANPDIGVCGTYVEYIGGDFGAQPTLGTHDSIYARLLFENAFAHPTMMLRSEAVHDGNLYYDEDILYAQDYELWSRAISIVKMAIIENVLICYRIHPQRVGSKYGSKQRAVHNLIYRRLLTQLQVSFTEDEIRLHEQINSDYYKLGVDFLARAQQWLEKISTTNRKNQIIAPEIMDAELKRVWSWVCRLIYLHPIRIFFYLLFHPFRFHTYTGLREVGTRFMALVKARFVPSARGHRELL